MTKTLTPKGPVISTEDMQYLIVALDPTKGDSKYTPDTIELRLLYALREKGWLARAERPEFTDEVVESFNTIVINAELRPRVLIVDDCLYYKSGKPK